MEFCEVPLSPDVLEALIALSAEWEAENSCYGYRKNEPSDLAGNRIFLARAGGEIAGYLFGHVEQSKNMQSIMPEGTPFFEVEELYVRPAFRSSGLGKGLFRCAEEALGRDASYLVLSTASRNWRAVLHFYIEELGMDFWSARLFKKLS